MGKLKVSSPLLTYKKEDKIFYQSNMIKIDEKLSGALIRLQVFSRANEFKSLVSSQLNFSLPTEKKVLIDKKHTLFWSAPGEWIMLVDDECQIEMIDYLSKQLKGSLNAITLITDSRTLLKLSGDCCRELLAKGSSVDFHPSKFMLGTCVTTKFSQIPVMIAQLKEEEFLLMIDRSLSAYLLEWLMDAATEFETVQLR